MSTQFIKQISFLSNKLRAWILIGIGLMAVMIISCNDDTKPVDKKVTPKAQFTSKASETNPLEYTFTNVSENGATFEWNFGDGSDVKKTTDLSAVTHTYSPKTFPAEYVVKLTAKSTSGETHSSEEKITITTALASVKNFIAGAEGSLNWKIARVTHSLYVAPSDFSEYWWGIDDAAIAQRPCLYNYEWSFTKGGKMTLNTKDNIWVEGGVLKGDKQGCYTKEESKTDKNGVDISSWQGGTFDYTIDETGDKPTLKISGKGGFIGSPKISGKGTEEASTPQTETTYTVDKFVHGGSVADTLKLLYIFDNAFSNTGKGLWLVTLVRYKSADQEPKLGGNGGKPVDSPFKEVNLDFEAGTSFQGFEGATVTSENNPSATGINTSTKVSKLVKPASAKTGAGGFQVLEPIDFGTKKKIKVKVYAAKAVKVTFKVEVAANNSVFIEKTADMTQTNTWEELTFDFSDSNPLPGLYDKLVIIFDNGTVGTGEVYYFDDITQSN